MRLNPREAGIAMLYALLLMVVVMGVATLMAARTLGEIKQSGDDAGIVQSLMVAQGGANFGLAILQQPVRNALQTIVQARSSTTSQWSFGTGSLDQSVPTPQSVRNALNGGPGSLAAQLQPEIDALVCARTVGVRAGGTATVRIYVSDRACNQDLPGRITLPAARFVGGQPRNGSGAGTEQTYALPFVMVADGLVGPYRRNVVLQGEYDFSVGRPSFARYALFTNVHELPGHGGDVWFTDDTLFDGPIHTNQYFRFYHKPWFGGEVTSAGCADPGPSACNGSASKFGAEFFGRGFVADPGPTPSFGPDAPQLTAGVDWSSAFVQLPQKSTDQASAAEAGGLLFDGDLSKLTMWAAGANGAPLTRTSGGSWAPEATYQYLEACTDADRASCTLYRYGPDGALYEQKHNGGWTVDRGAFNGVIYVKGTIARLTGPGRAWAGDPSTAPPALASFAQLTVASEHDTRITGDLTYENQPCLDELHRDSNGNVVAPTCHNDNAANVLGVYAQGGNILIGNGNGGSLDAPDDVHIDGVLMSASGTVAVENHAFGPSRGGAHLFGGVIEYAYGAFGTFDARSGDALSGYAHKITYDRRMARGLAPPHFPTVGSDRVQKVALVTYGKREQVY
jgi:hypothetical protein